MKNFTGITGGVLVLAAILLAGCSNSYKSPTGPSSPTASDTVTPFIATGSWVVAALVQRTEDKTSQFSGYTFNFTSTGTDNGTVTATRNGATVSGTWRHSASVTYYGGTPTNESIALNLGTSSPFDRLTKTWNVVSTTSATFTLVSPEVLEDMHLVLTKQ
ncbi:MAG: hypothetical protein ABIZ36_09945 [Gemmatimonadaceae bacterium]